MGESQAGRMRSQYRKDPTASVLAGRDCHPARRSGGRWRSPSSMPLAWTTRWPAARCRSGPLALREAAGGGAGGRIGCERDGVRCGGNAASLFVTQSPRRAEPWPTREPAAPGPLGLLRKSASGHDLPDAGRRIVGPVLTAVRASTGSIPPDTVAPTIRRPLIEGQGPRAAPDHRPLPECDVVRYGGLRTR